MADCMLLLLCVRVTNHCSVQERGDVEDFVQTHGRVDTSVQLASTKQTTMQTQTDNILRKKKTQRQKKRNVN